MKRVIVTYEKLTTNILELLVEKYPFGFDYKDVISFKNSKGELVKAVQVSTEDTVYLVKISTRLEKKMETFNDDDFSSDEDNIDSYLDNNFIGI
ncbi:hypothetical protein [Tenacibaculum sp. M341]|uniref:hypothetical protein n=1 Tax=Tenacibaculum sp. M341 TaxID=2530339 RepID=UPI00104F446E|nr:hypothetical protein [Tenacibaculum sp. M341]TCI90977.1 hypothetical protein EYW44_11535 [Tenacibaculum sp. M341]